MDESKKITIRGFFVRHKESGYMIAIFIGLLIPCLLFDFSSLTDVYKFFDKNGIVHFSNVRASSKFNVWIREEPVHFLPETDFTEFDSLIEVAAHKYGVDYALVKAVIKTESNFNHKAVSKKGAKGLMQLMPRTASILGVNDCFHPEDNIIGGIRHLSYLIDLFNGNIPLALAAYNAGEGTVAKYHGIPPYPETRIYIRRVLDNYSRYKLEAINVAATVNEDEDQ